MVFIGQFLFDDPGNFFPVPTGKTCTDLWVANPFAGKLFFHFFEESLHRIVVDKIRFAVKVELGVAVDDGNCLIASFDSCKTEIAQFVSVAFDGDQVGCIGLGEFVQNGSGDPRTHGAEAVATMDNDIELTFKGKGDQVSFNCVHRSSFNLFV